MLGSHGDRLVPAVAEPSGCFSVHGRRGGHRSSAGLRVGESELSREGLNMANQGGFWYNFVIILEKASVFVYLRIFIVMSYGK